VTIAVCYLSPEGVVLGADSTASAADAGGLHYFNHNQKLYEVGKDSTLGIVTWGLGSLFITSHRTLIAQLGDDLAARPAQSVLEATTRWRQMF